MSGAGRAKALILAAILLAGGLKTVMAQDGGQRIGLLAPLSGPFSAFGEQLRRGAEAALSGSGIQLVIEDDQCSESGGRDAANRLIGANVAIAVGGVCWRAGLAALDVLDASGRVLITPAITDERLTAEGRGGRAVFRLAVPDRAMPQALAEAGLTLAPQGPVVVLAAAGLSGEALSESLAEALDAAGRPPAHREIFEPDEAGLRRAAARAEAEAPRLVFLLGGHADLAALTAVLRTRLGDGAVLIGAESLSSPEYPLLAEEAANGVYFLARSFLREQAEPERLAELEAEEPALGYVLAAYAATEIAAAALAAEGPLRLTEEAFATIIGPVRFSSAGETEGLRPVLYRWQDGVPVRVTSD
ncbi:MAG: ABC transporter substrate-binding protein [Hyphomicrobiaceae bacterium]|nr:ABC transporter substrate-binding protein [Hyphomicrobiaceae bacterium]